VFVVITLLRRENLSVKFPRLFATLAGASRKSSPLISAEKRMRCVV
jgi:hypothetical protein